MIVKHYRKDFIDHVIGHRVIIIAHQDVDAACTVKILTNLFKTEGVSYVLLSCCGVSDMRTKYDDYAGQSNIFLLVNCGATVDLLETLGNPPTNKKFFIIDYHRPIHILNYYNTNRQVWLVSGPEPEEKIPEFDQVFNDDPEPSDDELDDDEIDENGKTAEMRRGAKRRELQRKRNEWLSKREKILFKYREYSFYARPSSLHALEVAWVMSRNDLESFWHAVVALTNCFMLNRISRDMYMEYACTINDKIIGITNAENLPRSCLNIRFEEDLYLLLYRNWSVYESTKVTPYAANTLKTWSVDGIRRFHRLLATIGLPLAEAKQKYLNMKLDIKQELVEMFSSDEVANFKLRDMVFGLFVGQIGYRAKFNALDVQLAVLAVLENPDSSKSSEVRFLEALQVLDVRDASSYQSGIEKAKVMLKQLSCEVQTMVDSKQLREYGPFIFAQLADAVINYNFFSRPSSISLLVNFLQHAGVRSGKRHWRQCPWIVMIPYSLEYLVVAGVPPGAYALDQKNIFCEVFRVLKTRMPQDLILDFFDGWVILLKTDQREKFAKILIEISA